MVLYLKYRPQTLDELLGQETVKSLLSQSFLSQKLAHAYLFCGPRGTGKTSTARILAKMINCEKNDKRLTINNIPCNSCSSCLSITDGTNLDVYEIDAASNRGIDDIRSLREKVKLSPSQAKKKVYIIDEVHMLTTEAFNALLKTLEEPPAHVLFILATTEAHKIPQTILSRVQKLDFQLAKPSDLLQALKKVTKNENLKINDEALQLIAKRSEGSFRDALKLVDQLASSADEVTMEVVENLIKSGNFEQLLETLQALAKKDAESAVQILATHLSFGINIKEYTQSLIDLLRSILLTKLNAEEIVRQGYSPGKFQALKKLGAEFEVSDLLKIIDKLHLALERFRFAAFPSLPLEIALIESSLKNDSDNQNIPTPEPGKKEDQEKTSAAIDITVEEPKPKVSQSLADDQISSEILTLRDQWQFVLETVKPFNYSLEALLRSARLLSFEGDRIILEVPYSFHQRILETPRNRDMLESVFSDVLQKSVKIGCSLSKRPARVEEISNVEVAADDEVIRLAAEIFNSDSTN